MGKEIMADQKLSTFLSIRLTPQEKKLWQEKAKDSGISLADLLRQAMKRTKVWTITDKSLLKEKNFQLSGIGNNLNQLARWANTYKSKAKSVEILAVLVEIREELKKLSADSSSSLPSPPMSEGGE